MASPTPPADTDDEFLCFCGWVTLHPAEKRKENKKLKRLWLCLRGGDLSFCADEEVSLTL